MGAVTRCEGLSQYSVGSEPLPCLQAATGRYRSMCVHEHKRTAALCRGHADRESTCITCYEADGHLCPLAAPAELLEVLGP
jgi:hypothetical protein